MMSWLEKHFSHCWPFVRGIYGSLLDSLYKGPVMQNFDIFLWCWPEQADGHTFTSLKWHYSYLILLLWTSCSSPSCRCHLIVAFRSVNTKQCGAVITWSIFLKIIIIDTPYLAHEGELLGVCCEFEVWFTFCCCNRSAVCNIMINWTAL